MAQRAVQRRQYREMAELGPDSERESLDRREVSIFLPSARPAIACGTCHAGTTHIAHDHSVHKCTTRPWHHMPEQV